MFEATIERAERHARTRAVLRSKELAQDLAAALPAGIESEAVEKGVRLSGRGARRRLALDPALRWLVARLVR